VRLVVLLPTWNEELARRLEAIAPGLKAAPAAGFRPRAGEYVYAPRNPQYLLSADQLRNVLLCLSWQDYDFAVVSYGLAESPILCGTSGDDNLVLSAACYQQRVEGKPLPRGSRGRLLRLLPAPEGVQVRELSDLTSLGLGDVHVHGPELRIRGPRFWSHRRGAPGIDTQRLFAYQPDGRKLIFVLPMFMAVGGVERNTIEMLRRLRDRFAFVLITTERLRPGQGSLHHQLQGLCEAVFDLGEVAASKRHLGLLECLAADYSPSLIWICNGSPWLVQNAQALRDRFATIPIVDQEVYDEKAGWIQHFDNPGIRRFDRFIAINSRIQRRFVEQYKIAPERIDRIYPVIDPDRFRCIDLTPQQHAARLEELGLPTACRLFGFVGRLTPQKRPLDFLDLARRAREAGLDDHFLLIGDGELAAVCEAYIAEHKLSHVHRIPFCDDMSRLLPLLAGMVITSEFEGLPVALLEALAMGVPALATDVGDVRSILEEYEAGLVVPAIGDGIQWFTAFLAWRKELARLSRNAVQASVRVRQRFSAENAAACYERCWQDAWRQKLYDVVGGAADSRRYRGMIAVRAKGQPAPISVVISTCNHGPLLRQTLDACLAHAGGMDLELVVIDDGSRDATPRHLSEFAATHGNLVWRSVPQRGLAETRNLGISLAQHDLILLLDDDIRPQNDAFFRMHAELHAADPSPELAVLGNVVWPDRKEYDVNAMLARILGAGEEPCGHSRMAPCQDVDFRFFQTCNTSLKKSLVGDWRKEGFNAALAPPLDDVEFAYRMTQRHREFRIFRTPLPVGARQQAFSVEALLQRLFVAGTMAKVFMDLHPEADNPVGAKLVFRALRTPSAVESDVGLADYASIVEGLKSWARVLEQQRRVDARRWHDGLLQGIGELCFAEGVISTWNGSRGNFALAYRGVLDQFAARMQCLVANEGLDFSPASRQIFP
jgi:glycosyltransferase involved in cell wall biosynthesis